MKTDALFPGVAPASGWRWVGVWFLLVLPTAILFPPIPIDETRYLSVAWEMFNSGQWLVPTANGVWYSDKSPLLFWLITAGWKLFGVHTWVARIEVLLIALAVLVATRRLVARMEADAALVERAMWLLAGFAGFAFFATAIMFDLLLALCVLGALHALLDLDARRYLRGIVLLGLWIGLGTLAKGPVVLLHIAGAALLAPLWSESARGAKTRWYLSLLAGIVIGVAITLCWLLPAAFFAGPSYWQPLIAKITGRVAESFSHRRPFWWYLPLLPLLLLPWTLALRAHLAAWHTASRGRIGAFLLCWWLPAFIAFCVISGKQIHYLAPLLPAWAWTAARLLQSSDARLRPGWYALFALLAAAGAAALPWVAGRHFGYPPNPAVALFALPMVAIALAVWWRFGKQVRALALSATALASLSLLAGAYALKPSLDVRPEADFIASMMRGNTPVAHVQWHNSLFGYTGRLRRPLPEIEPEQVVSWSRQHPRGWLIASDGQVQLAGIPPAHSWPYFLSDNRKIGAWRAADVLAAQRH